MNPSDRVWRERGLRSAVLAGDELAWRTWYEESYESLAAYVAWRCAGLRDLADDVVQDTWLTAVRRIRSFDPERGSFVDWLRGIAANHLRNHFRRLDRREKQLPSLNGQYPDTKTENDPLARRDLAEGIAQTLAAIDERYEAVLRAKYLDQQRVEDIARAWNETPKTIESLLTRARQAFREAYGQPE